MKKTFTLCLLMLGITFTTYAQRMIDLSATMVSPTAGTVIDSGVSFSTKVIVTNVGTTPTKATDSIIYSVYFGQSGLDFNQQGQTTIFYRTNYVLNQNDTIEINRNFAINYTTPTANDTVLNYCLPVGILNRSADSARDNVTSNNNACQSVTRKARYSPVGIHTVSATDDINTLNQVYPNPAGNSFVIDLSTTNAHNVVINVVDMTGRVVLTQDRGKLAPGNYLMRLDTDKLQTGIYLYNINIDGDVKAGRISIVK